MIDQTKLDAILSALGLIAAQVVPGANVAADIALVRGLIGVGSELNSLLAEIKSDPESAWPQVEADYADAVDAFKASMAATVSASLKM